MLGPPPPVRFCSLFKDTPLPSSTNVLFECPLIKSKQQQKQFFKQKERDPVEDKKRNA